MNGIKIPNPANENSGIAAAAGTPATDVETAFRATPTVTAYIAATIVGSWVAGVPVDQAMIAAAMAPEFPPETIAENWKVALSVATFTAHSTNLSIPKPFTPNQGEDRE